MNDLNVEFLIETLKKRGWQGIQGIQEDFLCRKTPWKKR